MADDNQKSAGGSVSDVATAQFKKNQETAKETYNTYASKLSSNFGPGRLNEIWENAQEIPGNFVNNAIGNIGNAVDNAIRTGSSNIEGLVQGRINSVVGGVEEKINNKINSTIGKIESKLQRGILGKVNNFLGNPLGMALNSTFGGLIGTMKSELLKNRDPYHEIYTGPDAQDINRLSGNKDDKDKLMAALRGAAHDAFGEAGAMNGRTTGKPKLDAFHRIWNASGYSPAATGPSYDGFDIFSDDTFASLAETIKNSYGMTGNISKGKDLERNFVNRLGVTLIDNTLAHTRTHIFIGKPTCNLQEEDSNKLAESVRNDYNLAEFILRDYDLFLQLNGRIDGATPWMTSLQNRIVGISFQDATLDVSNSPANRYGSSQEYGINYGASMINIPINLTFAMDRQAEAFKLIYAWVTYIDRVKDGLIIQHPDDTVNNRMSYTCPIFIFCTEEDDLSITYWAKLVGNFPKTIPFSVFSNQGMINREIREITVSFASSVFKPFDINALYEFNEMQKRYVPKKYYDKWLPKEDRNLQYYWTNGAEVIYDNATGRYKLVPFSSAQVAPKMKAKVVKKNGFFKTVTSGIMGAIKDPRGTAEKLMNQGANTASGAYDAAVHKAQSMAGAVKSTATGYANSIQKTYNNIANYIKK
nr:MAG TPA: hypothetical protein [Caudoviricetes sp.]